MRNVISYILPVMFFLLLSCKQKSVKGVVIEYTLYEHQTTAENKKLCGIINKCLTKEPSAFIDLGNFQCGGGAGCYDLGYILTQIINRIGEKKFILVIQNFPNIERRKMLALIEVGLEYGDNNYDNKLDDAKIETTYPNLKIALTKMTD